MSDSWHKNKNSKRTNKRHATRLKPKHPSTSIKEKLVELAPAAKEFFRPYSKSHSEESTIWLTTKNLIGKLSAMPKTHIAASVTALFVITAFAIPSKPSTDSHTSYIVDLNEPVPNIELSLKAQGYKTLIGAQTHNQVANIESNRAEEVTAPIEHVGSSNSDISSNTPLLNTAIADIDSSSSMNNAVDTNEDSIDAQLIAKSSEVIETTSLELESQIREVTQTLKSGDNLSKLFAKVGLSATDVYRITKSGKEGKALKKMFPGESLRFEFNGDNLTKILREKSPLETVAFTPLGKTFVVETIVRKPEYRNIYRSAVVNDNLSNAASKADISQQLVMNMANLFGGVIDFALDVRTGDRFTVIYEELYLDGEKISDGNIIAAQYINKNKPFNAYRYEESNGSVGYFNEEGVSMRKAFLRAPLDFTRVSSGFNLRRIHPITKKVRPHRGIDYAAPRGTPVYSAGEGRVLEAGYSKANGNYIFVKHGESYTTKYLHLHKKHVTKGQRVKQGQTIGQVGCTGLCTGPHLHYEFLVNGVHRNPKTIVKKLPKAKTLAKAEMAGFSQSIASTKEILEMRSQEFAIASQ